MTQSTHSTRHHHVRHLVALGCLCILSPVSSAADVDGDGIDDALEQQLLAEIAPVWYADAAQPEMRPPLPIDWYIRHCELTTYDEYDNGNSSPGVMTWRTGAQQLTLSYLNAFDFSDQGPGNYYRLRFKDPQWPFQNGIDPGDTITWQRLNDEQRGVYGRVSPLDGEVCPDRYLVQYYMFFGFNDTDIPFDGCNDLGRHEGDVIGVEFEVFAPVGLAPMITRAVYNNHGRKVFIDNPGALDIEDGHPVVYLEVGSQEPLPWIGECGFDFGEPVPACISTNRIIPSTDIIVGIAGGECGDWQSVRQHRGDGPRLLVTDVVNIGERLAPMPHPEAIFIERFPGRYGDYAEDRVCLPFINGCWCEGPILPTVSPEGPLWGGNGAKMWDRVGDDDPAAHPAWPRCRDLEVVHVDTSYRGPEFGTAEAPFDTFLEAWSVVTENGTIVLFPGVTSEQPLFCKPMHLVAPEGPFTIAP